MYTAAQKIGVCVNKKNTKCWLSYHFAYTLSILGWGNGQKHPASEEQFGQWRD